MKNSVQASIAIYFWQSYRDKINFVEFLFAKLKKCC